MKKLINSPAQVVSEMLDGLLALYPGVSRLSNLNVLLRADSEAVRGRQVALISGGGSGHEPAHAGYIGAGMLSAAVAGEIFTSPATDSILAAIRAVAGNLGVLLIIKNYTGDRLNFGLAAEMARSEGFLVESVVVADDVALAHSQEHAGRRGLAGTVLVHKIAGAAAAEGKDLPQVASIAQAAAEQIGTMGVALSAGTSPGANEPSFKLGNEVELGLGIHGEPGVRRVPMNVANKLVDEMLHQVVATLRLRTEERIVALINNLGATTPMELAIVGHRVLESLASRGLRVERLYAGTFLTSLDMAGVSLSVMRVDDERLRFLDAPTLAPAWPNMPKEPPGALLDRVMEFEQIASISAALAVKTEAGKRAKRAVAAACQALIDAEDQLTEMDRVVGDGDLGNNMARAARKIQQESEYLPFDHSAELLKTLALALQHSLGGSSGPLYGVLFLRAAGTLEQGSSDDPKLWAAAMMEGCGAIGELGGARPGDRTMLDALIPFARTFGDALAARATVRDSLLAAIGAAKQGAENTAQMKARRGRSSYLGERTLGYPDPGAIAVTVWLSAVIAAIVESRTD